MILSIILPVHNEEEIIERTFEEIYNEVKKTVKSVEFILVENGSSDETLKKVKILSIKFPNTKATIAPKGYGSAILKGLRVAHGNFICYMPSDGQVDMKIFPSLWKLSLKNSWHIIKVKRSERENLTRTVVSVVFSLTIAILFRTKSIDINGSPRIVKRQDLNLLSLRSVDSFIDTEQLIKATKLGWKIKEIPMQNLARVGGKSTRSFSTFLEFFSNIYRYRFGGVLDEWISVMHLE